MHTFKEYADLVKKEHALNKTIAPNETGTTASKAYAVGEEFIRNGILYKVKTAIASGATWANISSSYEAASNVTAQVNSLKETLSNQANYNTENGVFNELPSSNVILGTKTVGNVTFTRDNDGTISATGTAGSEVWIKYNDGIKLALTSNKKFVGAPSGSSASTWFIDVVMTDGTEYKEYGEGVTLPSGKIIEHVYLVVKRSQNPNGAVYKPMLVDASLFPNTTYDDYVPFAASNIELTQKTTGLIDNTKVNGCVNSLGITKAELHSINTVGSWSGETYTESGATFACEYDDAGYLKKVTVNKSSGTESNSSLYLKLKPEFPYLPIKLIGCPSGGGTNWDDRKYYLYYANWSDTTGLVADFGNGGIITSQFNYSTYANARLSLQIKSGQTANNLVFYPMLIPPTMQGISNGNPASYAKSNRELTEDVEEADHYVSGESFGGSNGAIIPIGCSNASGTSIYLQIPLPKNVIKGVSVPSGKYNIPINWVRANGQSITSGLTVDTVSLLRPGMLGLTVSGTFSAMTLYAVSLGSWTVIVP